MEIFSVMSRLGELPSEHHEEIALSEDRMMGNVRSVHFFSSRLNTVELQNDP